MTRWSVAARFITVGEAEIALSALDAAGIDCDLVDENITRMDWGMAQAVGGVKVVVRPEDLDAAREVLSAPAGEQTIEPITAEPSPPDPAIACPECGSRDYLPIPRARIFFLLAAVFLGIGAVVGEPLIAATAFIAVGVAVMMMPAVRCTACGRRWSPPEPVREVEAQGPDARDMVEDRCPRCGSLEVHAIDYRRVKAIPLLFSMAIWVVVPVWLLSPKRICDACGLRFR